MSLKREEAAALFLILLLALGLRFWGLDWGLPYQYQSEEYKVVKYALRMGAGDLNPHFFEYPSLYLYFMLFLYGCYFLAGKVLGVFASVQAFSHQFVSDPTAFYVIGRSAEALFGAGVCLLAYAAGKKMFSAKAGLLAALMTAVLPEFVNKAHFTKGDMAAVFLGLLFWLSAYRLYEAGEKKHYVWAGVFLGLAVSTKYYLAMMGIALPLAHFLSLNRKPHGWLALSLALIPVFFVLGTPYALLAAPEFLRFFSDQSGSFSTFSAHKTFFLERVVMAARNMAKMSDFAQFMGIGTYGLGGLCFAGLFYLLFKRQPRFWLLTAPILVYWAVVSGYHNPAAGYMAPVFPLFIVGGAWFILEVLEKIRGNAPARAVFFILVFFCGTSALAESLRISYAYTLKDTRTLAKEWIEANVPAGSCLLMDGAVNSPPLEMSRDQLEKFYKTAVESGHYKKEYFRLKLEVLKPETPGYRLYTVKRDASEIGSLKHQVDEAQKTQDLAEAGGGQEDFERLKGLGIGYVIVNAWSEEDALRHIPALGDFYRNLPQRAKKIRDFVPESRFHPGPEIKIYRLD